MKAMHEANRRWTRMTLRHEGSEWVLYNKAGDKVLGRHETKRDAEAQERAIQAHKHA
jgi:hypothetical protein